MINKQNSSERRVKAPNIPKKGLGRGLPEPFVQDQNYYSLLTLAQEDLSGQDASHISFDQVILQQIKLSATIFNKLQLLDCRFTGCDIANAEWAESNFHRVELLTCHCTGFRAIEAQFQDVFFKECHATLAQFRFSTFKSIRFEHCDLSEADFQEATLSNITFIDCNLRNASFSGAKLVGVDLRGSQIEGLRAGFNELKGAILDPTQALAFVRGMGIQVKLPTEEL